MSNKVKIKIFSDFEDNNDLLTALKQLELKDTNVSSSIVKTFSINDNEIIVYYANKIDSIYLDKLVKYKTTYKNKIVIVTKENNGYLLSSLAKLGFDNFFVLPTERYNLSSYLFELIKSKRYLTRSVYLSRDEMNYNLIIGESESIRKIINLSKRVSDKNDINILIMGETGTGKGMLAKAIHNNAFSPGPFIDIVCTAIPESLIESELFGHEAGAFTGAKNRKVGLFELAEKGSLFLDEIGDLSINMQSKLLRTIEKKVIRRLGGLIDIPVNSRIISATNKDLASLVESKIFREDLFYRLNVVTITLPPLRERGNDPLILAEHFIKIYNKQFNKNIKTIEREAKQFILNYTWPGNIRELKNSIERAVLLNEDSKLRLSHFSQFFKDLQKESKVMSDEKLLPHLIRMDLNYNSIPLKKLSKIYAKEVLSKLNGNKFRTAKLLNISRPNLDNLLK
ncbi:MAG: sigma-54 interaction domain-containing protein [Syntrophothermus sp.]|nr:sigma-54 dependent transcriptional regulator [Ignavibacteriaceae bacterium]